ncbi:hypothetical protein Tco_1312788 [Tanacetum coccineum]
MFHNLDQLRLQLERENLHGVNAKTCLQALRTQFKEFLASKGVNATDLLNQAVIHKVVNTYGVLRMKENEVNALKENGSQLHDEILHEHQIKSSVKTQSQDIQIKPVEVFDNSLIVSKGKKWDKSLQARIQVAVQELYHTSWDADIRPVLDEEPFAEIQLTVLPKSLLMTTAYEQSLLARTTLICNLKKQIKSVKETSNEATVKNDIDVIETINIELEHSVAKLLAANEQLHKENEHLKQTYKELFDSIKKTKVQNKDNSESLISQINQKFVENADLKAQLQKRESAAATPHQMQENTQDKTRIPSHMDMNSTIAHCTPNACTPKPSKQYGVLTASFFILMTFEQKTVPNLRSFNVNGDCWHLLQAVLKKRKGVRLSREKESVRVSAFILDNEKRNLFGKSISLTEAEEEAVAREVHATHARIMSGPDPEPMQEDQTGSNSGKLHVSLAGPNPEHMDDEFLVTAYPKVHENLKLITDERVIKENPESHSGSMSSMKNLDDTYNFGDQFLYDKPTEDDQEKSKVIEESDSTIPDPSHQTVTSTPPVIAPFTNITPFIALQLRVARLEQEMSEVKKTDHQADVLASIKSQVPMAVDKYLGTKLDDALLKILERHTADLIEKYSVLPGPESVKNQESEKSPKEIIRAKKEQDEEKQDSTYSIRSTDKVDLEEFDLKSALFNHMNKNKSANRNTANYHLYHALIEALITDEDAMDKEVADKSSLNHPKDDGPKFKETTESDASASKTTSTLYRQLDGRSLTQEMLLLTLRCTDLIPNQNILNNPQMTFQCRMKGIRTGKKKLCKADLEGPSYHALVKAFIKNNRDKERKIALSISKLKAARYLDFGLEGELVPSLWVESERIMTSVRSPPIYDISAAYGITYWWLRRKQFYINKHSELSDREVVRSQMRILSVIRVKTFEKYRYNYLREIILRRADYKEYKISEKDFKNLHPNDFEDLNRVGDLQLGIESYQTNLNLEHPNWDATDYSFKEDYTIVPKPRAVIYRDRNNQRKLMRLNEIHKFSDGTLTRVMEKLDHMVKDFHLFEYNKGMETRKWSEDDKRRSKDFIIAIEKRLQIRRIFRSPESFVGGRIRDIDYRLINRTT